ncbi:MAG: alkaline phosphatase family protein [Roseibium sp.]|uniref:alkaline phosphatase family protein n=1 Tax=Roseibium sp. TaxID=1936156 RepID=UPI003D9C5675
MQFATSAERQVPAVLAGPILRKTLSDRLCFWLAVRAPASVRLEFFPSDAPVQSYELRPHTEELACLRAGEQLFYLMIDLRLRTELQKETLIGYRLSLQLSDDPSGAWQDHESWAEDFCYPGWETPFLRVPDKVSSVMHGSCRKPHSQCRDGLVAADRLVAECLTAPDGGDRIANTLPEMLVLSGDQVYVDDVAGPMLQAIMFLAGALGLPDESFEGPDQGLPHTGAQLRETGGCLYHRDRLLPKIDQKSTVFDVLFGGTNKPVFTSAHARNHLITLGEMLSMYLLVWSPAAWSMLPELTAPESLDDEDRAMYAREQDTLRDFVKGLGNVRRLLAHIPTAMIFDDHDVTDDWNLSLAWEDAAYAHPLSRRVIGNALIAYGINQGWGNRPAKIRKDLGSLFQTALAQTGTDAHDEAIDHILGYESWDFIWPTQPPLIALDTRTRRWRSEKNARYPSGLLDWEAATDLQTKLRGQDAVLLVSAAPIFGVKLIEVVQRFFTLIGKPLMVDAEYWMAHPGTASAILNIFQHRDTPRHFVILSGDVHYSFVYDVELRNGHSARHRTTQIDPKIWQICSSGIKNRWPDRLIAALDHGNRWAFSPRSPLNWLTKRRGMRIVPRKPQGTPGGRRILNAAGIGVVELDDQGAPTRILQLSAEGRSYAFERREAEARLD